MVRVFPNFLGEGGGSAKICPALGEEHARQVLGIDLQFPEEMAALTEAFPPYYEMVKKNHTAGVAAKKNPLVKEPDMYGFERMLNQILMIDEDFATQYKTADDSIVKNLMKLVEASPQLQEFVSASHIMHETLSDNSLTAQRNLLEFLKKPIRLKSRSFHYYRMVSDGLKEQFRPVVNGEGPLNDEALQVLGKRIEEYIGQAANENNLLVEHPLDSDGRQWYRVTKVQSQKLQLTQQIKDIDRDSIIKYSAGQILFESAMGACLDHFYEKFPDAPKYNETAKGQRVSI